MDHTQVYKGGETPLGYAPPLITLKRSIYNLCKANVQLMNNLNVSILYGFYVWPNLWMWSHEVFILSPKPPPLPQYPLWWTIVRWALFTTWNIVHIIASFCCSTSYTSKQSCQDRRADFLNVLYMLPNGRTVWLHGEHSTSSWLSPWPSWPSSSSWPLVRLARQRPSCVSLAWLVSWRFT